MDREAGGVECVAMENRLEKNGRRSRPVCRSKLESEVFKYALRFRFIRGDCESLTVRQTRRTGCAPRVIFADEIFRRLCIHRIHPFACSLYHLLPMDNKPVPVPRMPLEWNALRMLSQLHQIFSPIFRKTRRFSPVSRRENSFRNYSTILLLDRSILSLDSHLLRWLGQ